MRHPRRNPSATAADLRSVWPVIARWIAGASFRPGVDWEAILAAHEPVLARLRPTGPLRVYRAAHGRADEFAHPSAWTLDRELAESLVADSLRFGPQADVRVLLEADVAPEQVWFVLPELQRAADASGAGIVVDSQEWSEVVLRAGAYRLSATDRRVIAATKKAWRAIAKLKTAAEKRTAAMVFLREMPRRNPSRGWRDAVLPVLFLLPVIPP